MCASKGEKQHESLDIALTKLTEEILVGQDVNLLKDAENLMARLPVNIMA